MNRSGTMRWLRRVFFPVRLAQARLLAGGQARLLVGIGVVAGAAAIAAVLGGRLVMQDRSLAQASANLPSSERSLAVAWFGSFGGDWSPLNRQVSNALVALTGREPVRAMLYSEAGIGGRYINLRAADGLARYVRLISGRFPAPCVPSHCEVLRIEGSGPIPSTASLRLIEVGRARLDPGAPFAAFIQPPTSGIVTAAEAYHRPQPSPVVLADGVEGLSRTPLLASFYRSYAWFVPLRPGEVHPWSIGAYAREVDDLNAELGAHSGSFQVTAPTDELASALAASRVAARRLLLLGGEAGALLLAFTVLAASALRRQVEDARRRLLWAGARRWQVELHTFAESGGLALVGTISGFCAGGAIAAVVAALAGSPPWAVVAHALLSRAGLLAGACVVCVAAALLYLAVRAPGMRLGRAALGPLDLAGLAAVAVVAVGYARGSVDPQSLQENGGTGVFVLLVPALITFAAATLAVRLALPALRAVGRLGRRGPLALRLAALSLSRNPGGATVTATFLVASLGLALFALSYRSTLSQGERDEASFAAPAPYLLDEDLSELVPVLHAWHGGPATPVLRLSGNLAGGAGFGFLAVPWQALPTTGGWRADFSARSLGALAGALRPPRSMVFRTTALPPGRTFTLAVRTSGQNIDLRAFFRSPLGDFSSVDLGSTRGARTVVLRAEIPIAGARLSSLELALDNGGFLTSNAGIGLQPNARGVLDLAAARVDGRPVARAFDGWVGETGAVRRPGAEVRVAYALSDNQTTSFRPREPSDGTPLRVLATPGVAAAAGPGGMIELSVEGSGISARVVGIVSRFPSSDGETVVADLQSAETALNALSPGLGTTDELWADALPSPAPTVLTITSRAALLSSLRADPLARGALLTLAATAALALALALVGLAVGIAADRRDERGELFDLEAQGASPATIRSQLRLRAFLVGAFGLVMGVLTGAVLTAAVLSLVAVTASAADPEPPLRLALDPALVAAVVAGYALSASGLVLVSTRVGRGALERAAEVA